MGRAINTRGPVMAAALFGAIAPDLDMIWFALVDSSIHHRRFWHHIPAVWMIIAAITLPLIAATARRWLSATTAFFAAVFLHLVLDTPTGGIMWLWPFDDRLIYLIEVPATRSHWVLSFLTHWTFAAELLLCALALFALLRRKRA